jgi:hypothetical protein
MAKVARAVTPGPVAISMPEGFSKLVTSCGSVDDLRELWKEAAAGGFLDQAKQLMENRKAVLSRG